MWYFQSVVNSDRKFCILPGHDYVIGRKDCDIIIENDQSVSRKHACLKVSYPAENANAKPKCKGPPVLSLTDLSKFGTLVNNKIVKGEKHLKHHDEIRFGSLISVHRVVYEPLVVAVSCLDKTEKREAQRLVLQLGGVFSDVWKKDCSLLVMNDLTVTVKVVCALVSQKSIVTVSYLSDLLQFVRKERPVKPDPENYLPTVTKDLKPGVSFIPNSNRSTVFHGMTFYFLCQKQLQKMNLAVELGGGVSILAEDALAADLEAFLKARTVVMNPAPGDITNKTNKEWVDKVKDFLMKNGKYLVQDAEIGYAVLDCSTEDYCNPDKDSSNLLSLSVLSQTLQSQTSQLFASQNTGAVEPSFPVLRQLKSENDSQKNVKRDQKSTKDISVSEGQGQSFLSESLFSDSKSRLKEVSFTADGFSSSKEMDALSSACNIPRKNKSDLATTNCGMETSSGKHLTVKSEEASSGQGLFDTELNPKTVFEKDKVVNSKDLLADDEDIFVQRKRPQSKPKRVFCDEQNPFDFVGNAIEPNKEDTNDDDQSPNAFATTKNKKYRQSSFSIASDEDQSVCNIESKIPKLKPAGLHQNLLPSAEPKGCPAFNSREYDIEAEKVTDSTVSMKRPMPLSPVSGQKSGLSRACHVQLHGFLNTFEPICDQITANSACEIQDIKSPTVLITFSNLITRTAALDRKRKSNGADHSDAPDGMIWWEGKLVCNFKKFRKNKHHGAGHLPKIIGGSDLMENCAETKKLMDDWLKQHKSAESQESLREKETDALFNWKPVKANNAGSGKASTSSRRGR